MVVLSIDSSSEYSNLLLMNDRFETIAEKIYDFREHGKSKPNHSVIIFRQIDDMLFETGLSLVGLSGISVLLGPGSFTGARISLVIAKTFSYLYGINIIGVGSLFASAYSFIEKVGLNFKHIAAIKDAGRGDYYASSWAFQDGATVENEKPQRVNTIELKSFIEKFDGDIELVYGKNDEEGYDRVIKSLKGVIEPLSFDLRELPFVAGKYLLESGIKNDTKYTMELSPVYVYGEGPF